MSVMQIEIIDKKADGAVVKLLSRQAVCKQAGMGKTKLYTLMKAGKFPKCHHIDVGIWRWRSDEVEAWIEAKAPRAEVAA